MNRNCEDCSHKPVCRLWYSEVESRFAKGQSAPLEELAILDEGCAKDCKHYDFSLTRYFDRQTRKRSDGCRD